MDNDKSIEMKRESMRYSPRRKLLELKDILYENADENNGITMKDRMYKEVMLGELFCIFSKELLFCHTLRDIADRMTDVY